MTEQLMEDLEALEALAEGIIDQIQTSMAALEEYRRQSARWEVGLPQRGGER